MKEEATEPGAEHRLAWHGASNSPEPVWCRQPRALVRFSPPQQPGAKENDGQPLRPPSGNRWRLAEVLAAAHGHICDEHDPGVPVEQRTQAREDRLNFLLRYDGHDHDQAFLLIEHKVRFTKSVMAFPRDIPDHCVTGRFNLIQ